MHRIFLKIALALLLPALANAQDEALYRDPAPADAVFVRFIDAPKEISTWKGVTFGGPDRPLSDYHVVHAKSVEGTPGDFLTVLQNGTVIIEPEKSAQLVQVGLINVSDLVLSLKTGDGNIEIIKSVASGESGWRDVNPITVETQVFSDQTPVGSPLNLALRRGEHQTILVKEDQSIIALSSVVLPGVVE